ncbi:hemolysin, partial [Vibrio anguillarum]
MIRLIFESVSHRSVVVIRCTSTDNYVTLSMFARYLHYAGLANRTFSLSNAVWLGRYAYLVEGNFFMTIKYLVFAVGMISLGGSMVQAADQEGCIISRKTGDKYCLNIGQRSEYSLPSWIYNH